MNRMKPCFKEGIQMDSTSGWLTIREIQIAISEKQHDTSQNTFGVMLEIKPWALGMLGKHSATALNSQTKLKK